MTGNKPEHPIEEDKEKQKAPTKPKRRRKRARKRQEEYISYDVRVTSWDCYYGLAIGDPKSRFYEGPYSETATVDFNGRLISPEGTPYTNATLTLSARSGMMEEEHDIPHKSLGSLSVYENKLTAYIFVPVERMGALVSLAQSDRVQIASIGGTRLRYRSGLIHNISLNTDPEELEEV